MTAIVSGEFKTKRAFMEALRRGDEVFLKDLTPFGTVLVNLNKPESAFSPGGHYYGGEPMCEGAGIACTNHPKRSWFAWITVRGNGRLRVE